MEQIGKLVLILGVILAAFGLLLWGLGKSGFKGLPGDIRTESDHVKFYFPVVTCLVISALATLVLWLLRWLRKG